MKNMKIKEKNDTFDFEHGRYYVQPDKVIFRKTLIWAKPFLLYFEGVPIPIGIENIKTKLEAISTDSDKVLSEEELNEPTEILINSQSIHDLVSTDVLSVLTRHTMTKFELLLLGLLVLTFLVSVAGVNI